MADLIHTFSIEDEMLMQEQEFLAPISIIINELKEPFSYKIKERNLINKKKIKVTIKTDSGNTLTFKKTIKKDKKTISLLTMTEEEAIAMAKAQGIAIDEEVPELMPAIGFAVPTEDDYDYEDE